MRECDICKKLVDEGARELACYRVVVSGDSNTFYVPSHDNCCGHDGYHQYSFMCKSCFSRLRLILKIYNKVLPRIIGMFKKYVS